MKVSRKIPFTVYTIICVVLLLALLAGIGWLTNFSSHSQPSSALWHNEDSSTNTYAIDSQATKIKINSNYGNISIQPTTQKPYLTITSNHNVNADITTKNGTCYVKIKSDRTLNSNFINNLFKNNVLPSIKIFLPAKQLELLDVTSSAGQFEIKGLDIKELEVDVSAGNVIIEDCVLDTAVTKLNAGNLKFYASNEIKLIESNVNAGNMDLYLPSDIPGINCSYQVNVGSISDKTDLGLFKSQKSGLNINGDFDYLDKSCEIKLTVTAGSIDIKDYN